MNTLTKRLTAGIVTAVMGTSTMAEDISLRIGSGHPPGVVYAYWRDVLLL